HVFGREARAAVEKAREAVAQALAVSAGEILFTSSATEANNLAIKGVALRCLGEPCHMILSAVEHSSVRNVFGYLKERFPHVSLTVLEVDSEGRVSPQALEEALLPETVLVSVMHANNETGAVQPVAELSEVVRRHGKALFHCDAVQTFTKLPVRPEELGADLLTVSSHKIYGPKGAGALYIRDNLKLEALHHGGSQEKRRRAGTEDTAAIVGFGRAVGLAQELHSWMTSHLKQLEQRFLQTLDSEGCSYMINGCRDNCLAGLLNLSFRGVSSQDLVVALDL
ncbi:MAG: cysteine desulfurase family protein, partial [bacterium]